MIEKEKISDKMINQLNNLIDLNKRRNDDLLKVNVNLYIESKKQQGWSKRRIIRSVYKKFKIKLL